MARWTRSLLLLLPLLFLGQSYGTGIPQADGVSSEITPIWTNSFEAGDCTADRGTPPGTTTPAVGFPDCSCTGGQCADAMPPPDGTQVWYGDAFESHSWNYNLDQDDLEEGWLRFRFNQDTNGSGNTALHWNGAYPTVYMNSAEKVWLRCPNPANGTAGTYVFLLDTWYIVQLHWWNFDSATEFPEAEANIYLQSDMSLVETVTCTGTSTWADLGSSTLYANNSRAMAYDCIEWYDADPGPPRTACNLNR